MRVITLFPLASGDGTLFCSFTPRIKGDRSNKLSKLLEGHLAVVTGGASGIGRAIAKGYAEHGAHVVILDANLGRAGEGVDRFDGQGAAAGPWDGLRDL